MVELEPRSAGRSWTFRLGLTVLVLLALGFGAAAALNYFDAEMVSTGPNGPQTPATVGLKFEHVAIASADRVLDGYLVRADPVACADAPALLIFHGVQETTSQWVGAQLFLHDHCVSSLVFDYAGSGNSSRPGNFSGIADDAPAVYAFARKAFPATRLYLLGHSLGNGPMLQAVAKLAPRPDGIVVANAFASLRGIVARSRLWAVFAMLIPDWWDNVIAVAGVRAPMLVVCSDADSVNPTEDSRDIFAAASQPKSLVILHGPRHNDLFRQPDDTWWQPVLAFLHKPPAAHK